MASHNNSAAPVAIVATDTHEKVDDHWDDGEPFFLDGATTKDGMQSIEDSRISMVFSLIPMVDRLPGTIGGGQ